MLESGNEYCAHGSSAPHDLPGIAQHVVQREATRPAQHELRRRKMNLTHLAFFGRPHQGKGTVVVKRN